MDSSGSGERFGSYELMGELASGAQGVVLDARREGRRVALKLLKQADPVRVARFEQEGRILSQLRHPNLPAVIELGREGGLPFLAMEFVEGDDLRTRLNQRGVPPFAWTVRTLQSAAHALHHCHQQGVVHRDVKPANIVIERGTGRPVLVDFGMIKRVTTQLDLRSLEDAAALLSRTGEIKGTPSTMAPEQISPDRFGQVSPRTDVYGLGATLFQLLTGEPPFEAVSLAALMAQILGGDVRDPRAINRQIPAPLADLCNRCLAKQQAARPGSALAFADALADAIGVERMPWIAPADPSAPRTLGGFEVIGELGRGGMGVVFLVRSPIGGDPLALKLMLEPTPERIARFEREARLMQTLGRHPGIVQVHDLGQDKGLPFLVMDRIPGGTLEDLILRGERDACVEKLIKVARAVHFANEAGVVHRDLKPANVLLQANGEPAVTDFGMAHDEQEAHRLTLTGQFVGTVSYMAPEQLRGGPVDRRADVYALGAMLYESLTGAPPHPGTPMEVLGLVMSGTPPTPPRELQPLVPGPLSDLCLRAMSVAPDDRPSTAEDFARELEAARDATDTAGGGGGATALLAVVGLVVVLGGAGLAWSLAPPPSDPESTPTDSDPEEPRPTHPPPDQPVTKPPADPDQDLVREPTRWYLRLPEPERPAMPLPPGVGFGREEGTYRNGADGSVLVFVPAGTFVMGSELEERIKPEHPVLISKGFFIGKYEVSWEQFRRFCDATNYPAPSSRIEYMGDTFDAPDDHPAFHVTWEEAMAYCAWADLRLPTSAESEYAARGPTSRLYPWGKKHFWGLANLGRAKGRASGADNRDDRDGYGLTAPVTAFPEGASWCGALNLSGNVYEWVHSSYTTYPRTPRVDPDPQAGSRRVFRGAGWANRPEDGIGAWRKHAPMDFRFKTIGFRVARDHPSDPGHDYPEGDRARVGAHVKAHPGDELASEIWHALPGD